MDQLDMISPDPSFVPTDSLEVDSNEMARDLTSFEITQLWHGNIEKVFKKLLGLPYIGIIDYAIHAEWH